MLKEIKYLNIMINNKYSTIDQIVCSISIEKAIPPISYPGYSFLLHTELI